MQLVGIMLQSCADLDNILILCFCGFAFLLGGDIVYQHTGEALDNVDRRGKHIKVAEASKIIENSQRDVNIAFMNELARVFNVMGIDTHDVIEAASSKWNFIKLSPGLVGGHCISVDPYYLIQKAQVYGV